MLAIVLDNFLFICFILQENLNQSTTIATTTDSKPLSVVTVTATATVAPPPTPAAAAAAAVTANNQATTEKAPIATNPPSSGYTAPSKKDEIKIVPAVVPVLGYTAAPPNIYQPPMDSGVQFVTGAQQTQPTSFSTTYQQGVSLVCIAVYSFSPFDNSNTKLDKIDIQCLFIKLDGSIYAVQQPMIYGYPTVVRSIFVCFIFLTLKNVVQFN